VADYKDTLNLPQTAFPMKADLAKREPDLLRYCGNWVCTSAACGIRRAAQVRAARRSALRQRGDSHRPCRQQGLKDIIVKSRTLNGFRCPLRTRLGLSRFTIEQVVEKKLARSGSRWTPASSAPPAAPLPPSK